MISTIPTTKRAEAKIYFHMAIAYYYRFKSQRDQRSNRGT
jgi:hypothetical protein